MVNDAVCKSLAPLVTSGMAFSFRTKTTLLLGYGNTETRIFEILADRQAEVSHSADPITNLSDYDLVVSFGYRHKLSADVLRTAKRPVINLHTSFLPFNRGAHPNFWAHYDGTKSGVTIHEMDDGLDTGPIIFQKVVEFASSERTFSQTYNRLLLEMENLFEENVEAVLSGSYRTFPQVGEGSYHRSRDLPVGFGGWDSEISMEINRLKSSECR